MSSRPGIDGPAHPSGDGSGRSGLRRTASGHSDGPVVLTPGQIVAGRYRILAPIGQGGMGTVYRAEQIPMRREVALKVMHASGAVATSARFEREAQAASRITSPHVVTIHDFGEGEDGLLYLAMELLEGESLAQRILRGGALDVAEAVAIAIEIARALAAAHAAGVIHRDLKPDNIHLVTGEGGAGQVKVLDFGIARIIHGDQAPISAHLTSADLVVGTPLYMSPEACSRGAVGPGADLYSLGVILFEMLTGKPPFDEREPVLLMSRHLEARPPRLRERRPDLDLPEPLDAIVDRLLQKKPQDRFASATDVAAALRGMGDSTARIAAPPRDAVPIRAEPTVLEPRELARSPRPARALALAGAAALGLAVLAAIGIALGMRPSAEPTVTPLGVVPAAVPPTLPQVAPPPLGAPTAAEAPESVVRVRFDVTPRDAIVLADGAPIDGHTLEIPRDGAHHAIEVRADGHAPQTLEVVGDVDRVVAVELAPAARSGRARAARRRARPTKRRDPLMREW